MAGDGGIGLVPRSTGARKLQSVRYWSSNQVSGVGWLVGWFGLSQYSVVLPDTNLVSLYSLLLSLYSLLFTLYSSPVPVVRVAAPVNLGNTSTVAVNARNAKAVFPASSTRMDARRPTKERVKVVPQGFTKHKTIRI